MVHRPNLPAVALLPVLLAAPTSAPAAPKAARDAGSEQRCHSFPIDVPASQQVTVCESTSTYDFQLGRNHRVFAKPALQTALRQSLQTWAATTGLASDKFKPDQIQIWLTMPTGSPEAAAMRVVLTGADPRFFLIAPLAMPPPTPTDLDIGSLEVGKTYPDSYGYRPRHVLLQPKTGADLARLAAVLASLGAEVAKKERFYWTVKAPAFGEPAFCTRLLHQPEVQPLAASCGLDALVEWSPASHGFAAGFPFIAPGS